MWSTAAVAIVFLSIARQTRCDDNTFITSGSNAFPSTITQGKDTKIYLRHVGGYIAAVRLSSGADSDDDSDLWIIGKPFLCKERKRESYLGMMNVLILSCNIGANSCNT